MARVYQWDYHKFYLPPIHVPCLPLLPSRKVLLPFDWYSLCLPTRDGQVELTCAAGHILR